MYIDEEHCRRCLDCLPVCPMGAIGVREKSVVIDEENCVECGVCRRMRICPEGAIRQAEPLPYPRILRAVFPIPPSPTKAPASAGEAQRK